MAAQESNTTQRGQEGEWLQSRSGERFCIRIPADVTHGGYSVTEIIASPGDSTPVHIHKNEDEHIHVLDGTVQFQLGEDKFEATSGTVVSLPRGIAHAWGNASDTSVRLIATLTPGGCEEALREIAIAGKDVDLMAIATRYEVSVVGPPLLG